MFERLTRWENNDKDVADLIEEKSDFDGLTEAINRLAAYEDIGKSPEEIISSLEDYKDISQQYSNFVHEMQPLKEAKAGGRLVVLPCKEVYTKAGDTLYLIDGGEIIEVTHCGAEISPSGEIYIVVAAEDKIFPFRQPDPENDLDPTDWCTETKEVMLDDFGKTVFLSREAAEKALEVGE